MTPFLTSPGMEFSQQVRQQFGRHAATYDRHALLQRAMAWRLGHLMREKATQLPRGPLADLGAGSGLLSGALLHHCPSLGRGTLLQLDICPELLAINSCAVPGEGDAAGSHPGSLVWNLNRGLPPQLKNAALLASSFALHWLETPPVQLAHWCSHLVPGGWLLLAVPTAGSFPQWRQAAGEAEVPCTALELPGASELIGRAVNSGLELIHSSLLRFTRPHQGGLSTLRHLRQLGACSGRHPPLSPGQIRRLLARWPEHSPLTWEVLSLVGRKR